MKKTLLILSWLLSLIIAIVYTYENPDKIDIIKYYFKRPASHGKQNPLVGF